MNRSTHTEANGSSTLEHAAQLSGQAFEAVQDGAARVAASTQAVVRRYPLSAVALALGGGVAAGVLGTRLLSPRPKTLLERLGLASLVATTVRGVGRFF